VAASLNRVILIGNLTRDPELRYLSSGTAVATFSIAVNRTYTTQTGEKKEEATFVRIVTWDKRAEVCNEYLKKGSPVCIEGRLQSRTWEAPDGAKRSTIEVIASNVQFLNRSSGTRVAAESEHTDQTFPEEVPPAEAINEKNNEEVPF
jgi:single-strand DNA-binding protein